MNMNIDRFLDPSTQTLIWCLTSHGYQTLTWNLVKNLQTLGIPWKLCVVCADHASYEFMRREGIPALKAPTLLPDFGHQMSPFGSGNFQRLNLMKLRLLDSFAKDERIKNCIYMDGDIAVYKDFLGDILQRLDTTPLLFQCDEQKRDSPCESDACPNVCSGFIAWKHGYDGGLFQMNDKTLWLEQPEDQIWINKKLATHRVPFCTLPRELYPNGVFGSLLGPLKTSFILHYNYRVGMSKVADMKRFGDWHLVV